MALYAYRAFKRNGTAVSGTMDATSVADVRERLTRMELLPTTITRAEQEQATSVLAPIVALFAPRASRHDVIFFTKQLAVLLKSGIPLVQSLELVIEQTEKQMQKIIINLKDGIKEGKSLADGLAQYPTTFSVTYVQLIRAGEASGKLEVILDRLVEYLERADTLRKKIQSAMSMPLIQLSIVLLVVTGLLTFVVPQLAGLFASQQTALPTSTQIMLSLSDLVINHYLLILIGLLALLTGGIWWRSTPSGRLLWDTMMLKLPLVGYFVRMGAVVQFCSTLGMLLESGVNLAESLTIVCRIINNRILVQALTVARDKIIKQGKITIYLRETRLFPPIALYLIKTGEESGQLGQMLLTVAQNSDTEVRDTADGLAEKLQPVMTVLMGAIVGFVVMAIGGPIMQLGDIAGGGLKGLK